MVLENPFCHLFILNQIPCPPKHSEVTPNSISLSKGNMPMKRNDTLLNEFKRIVSLKWQMQCSYLELTHLWLEQKGGKKSTLARLIGHQPGIGWGANTTVGRDLEAGAGLDRDTATWFANKWGFSYPWNNLDSSGYIHVESRAKELFKKICPKKKASVTIQTMHMRKTKDYCKISVLSYIDQILESL